MDTKYCSKCNQSKGFESFGKEIKGKYGIKSICKLCLNAQTKAWKIKNPEKIKCLDEKWKQIHPEKVKIAKLNWSNKNKDKVAKYGINSTKTLSNAYVSRKLRQIGFKSDELKENTELIEVKRILLKTKRLCRISQN